MQLWDKGHVWFWIPHVSPKALASLSLGDGSLVITDGQRTGERHTFAFFHAPLEGLQLGLHTLLPTLASSSEWIWFSVTHMSQSASRHISIFNYPSNLGNSRLGERLAHAHIFCYWDSLRHPLHPARLDFQTPGSHPWRGEAEREREKIAMLQSGDSREARDRTGSKNKAVSAKGITNMQLTCEGHVQRPDGSNHTSLNKPGLGWPPGLCSPRGP